MIIKDQRGSPIGSSSQIRDPSPQYRESYITFADPQRRSLIFTVRSRLWLFTTTDQHRRTAELPGATSPSQLAYLFSREFPTSVSMTAMVLENNSAHRFGPMSFDNNMYSSHLQQPPHFTDPWAHATHTGTQYPPLSKSESARPTTMSMAYPQMPVSAPLPSGSSYSNAGYGGSDLLSGTQDIPRSSYEQSYTSPSSTTPYPAPSYPAMGGYAAQMHHQQQQQQRRPSDQYVMSLLATCAHH